MPELSRTQVVVYGGIAVALLLVGARAIRAEGGGESFGSEPPAAAATGGAEADFSLDGQAGDLIVDVAGAVRDPGVYRLPAGSRVEDAVRRAGGATAEAELEAVNRAARLADGQQVVVPQRLPGSATGAASSRW